MSWRKPQEGVDYAEMEHYGLLCKHCGAVLQAYTGALLGYLGANTSFFCDPNNLEVMHEPSTN